ncbi:hypothetical protein KKB10_05280 [Patescibacteria group bacterium]|nr:hypothetical protein [Patescibacteria group bacterium]MBU1952315.1 hypothetical protein [Patescibacteria group bacterium]
MTNTKWIEIARRGKAHPFLVIDSIISLYKEGLWAKAHRVKKNIRNYRQFDNARWYGREDFKLYRSVMEKALTGKDSNLFDYEREYKQRITDYRRFADYYGSFDFAKSSNLELIRVFAEWYEHSKKIWCFAYDYIYLNQFLPDIVTTKIAAKIPDLYEQNKYIGIFFEADRPSEMRTEKRSLVKIAESIRKNKIIMNDEKVIIKLENHLSEYAYLGFYYFRGVAYTVENLKSRLREYLSLSPKKFKALIDDFRIQDRNDKLTEESIKKIELDEETRLQIYHIKRWCSLSNYVDETYGYVVHNLWGLWQEISHRLGIPCRHFYSLGADEIISALKKGKLSANMKREAKLRHSDHALILENGQRKVYSGVKLKQYTTKHRKREQELVKTKELIGQPASPGQARGKARLVFTVHDVRKVERGDILVANSTNPTYVPAMERAGAIVTDEGGLLSHAAIVSRELKVPCIVGTKIATRIFKDGDKVFVDAEKGVIKKI